MTKRLVSRFLMLMMLSGCLAFSALADESLGGGANSNYCFAECETTLEVCVAGCRADNPYPPNGGEPFCSLNCWVSYYEGIAYCNSLQF